jgi:predicted Fe-Mo cluster-binding NifX family protein
MEWHGHCFTSELEVMPIRVAITTFNSTISPLFESAQQILITEVPRGEAPVARREAIGGLDLAQRLILISRLGVEVLVCGAISGFARNALLERGVEVYPWISARVQDVLQILTVRYGSSARGGVDKVAVTTTGPDLASSVARSPRRCSHLLVVAMEAGSCVTSGILEVDRGDVDCVQMTRFIVEAGARLFLTGRCGPNAHGILALAGVGVVLDVAGVAVEAARHHLVDARSGPDSAAPRRGGGRWPDAPRCR